MPRTPTVTAPHPAYPGVTATYPTASSLAHGRASYGTVNRAALRKLAAQGTLWARCKYHYTDDYAHDAASDYGRSGWFRVALAPEWPDDPATPEEREARWTARRAWEDAARAAGAGVMDASDFTGSCGYARLRDDARTGPELYLAVHSNLVYELRTTPPDPVDVALDNDARRAAREASALWWTWWTSQPLCDARRAHQPTPTPPPEVTAAAVRARELRAIADAFTVATPAEVPA